MKNHGIDISDQRARQFQATDFASFDYIFAMDKQNYTNILALANSKEEEQKVRMIMNVLESQTDTDVPDPYYGGEAGFTNVYYMLKEASEAFAKSL